MRILIIGEGGRESALAAKLQNDSRITKMFFANGNATTDVIGKMFIYQRLKNLEILQSKKGRLNDCWSGSAACSWFEGRIQKHDLKVLARIRKWQA